MKVGEVGMCVEYGGEDGLRLVLVEVLGGCLWTLESAADFGPHRRRCQRHKVGVGFVLSVASLVAAGGRGLDGDYSEGGERDDINLYRRASMFGFTSCALLT